MKAWVSRCPCVCACVCARGCMFVYLCGGRGGKSRAVAEMGECTVF
jgi:hypothetical protein